MASLTISIPWSIMEGVDFSKFKTPRACSCGSKKGLIPNRHTCTFQDADKVKSFKTTTYICKECAEGKRVVRINP